ncbi:MAG: hypothetical protein HY891_03820 [Deltaproteobacteria bacterium]|nr:hypothetical protein [Deltaproteobacteria bacterium]
MKNAFLALAFVLSAWACCSADADIPVGSSAYDDFELLELKGLLKSGMLSTRPFSRSEGARLLKEAMEGWDKLPEEEKARKRAEKTIKRLSREFGLQARPDGAYLKPAGRPYSKMVYSDGAPYFLSVNNNGDLYTDGFNFRAGFSTEAGFSGLSLVLGPEYRADSDGSRLEFVYGYAMLRFAGIELMAGKEPMWWGPGYHGALLLTNNAKPLDMIRLTSSHPFLLPWIFEWFGPLKPTFFLARLEKERDFPRANLLGMRLDFKPTPRFRFGLNRVFMFGGEGRKSLGVSDWFKVFIASDSAEHSDSSTNGNQIVSLDASYVYVNEWSLLPFSGIKVYTEWGAEDSSGDTKTPTGRANIYGAYVDEPFWLANTDLRVEWANTARNARYGPLWYSHVVYNSGYTHEGRIIGHHMGTDARNLFARAQLRLEDAVIGLEYDVERSGIHGASEAKKRWVGLDLAYIYKRATLKTGLGLTDQINGTSAEGPTGWASITFDF